MNSAYQSFRATQPSQRKRERDEKARRRELERMLKEEAKRSEREQALLEVEAHENQIAVLLSVHKEQGENWDWGDLASSLPPLLPHKLSAHDADLTFRLARLTAKQVPIDDEELKRLREKAHAQDREAYESALAAYEREKKESAILRELAVRILAGDCKAYTEALANWGPFSEISTLGSSLHFIAHTPHLVECTLAINGTNAIPHEVKALTASGKLSVKPMPRSRFHELYQDYICGCMLRVAREVFALLPVRHVLITATASQLDSSTGAQNQTPVLSAAFDRGRFAALNFDHLDPSDAVESFPHRGDFKASRKSEAFLAIEPLTTSDLDTTTTDDGAGTSDLLEQVARLRDEIRAIRVAPQTQASASLS